jgi:WS/DGAT/MGAT family acyltransferase
MAAEKERMSAVDTAWLRMDRATNLMVILGVWVLDRPLDFARFRQVIAKRFMQHERFRCRPVDDLVSASWEPDDDFELESHVRPVALPAPAGKPELEALVSELAGTALDRRRPLWQFHLVENYAGGAAVIMRIHHCYADGIALRKVFLSLTDPDPEPSEDVPIAAAPGGKSGLSPGRALDFLEHLPIPGAGLMRAAVTEGADLLGRIVDLARHPDHANDLARHAVGAAAELIRVSALSDDPPTLFKGDLGTRKQAAWSEPLPLTEVRTVAHALGCTINDVLMAAAAGALGGYLRDRGEVTDGLSIRATVPVNLRDAGHDVALGNQFGLVFLDLPVGICDPLERVAAVHQCMSGLKGSYQPVLMLGLMAALGLLGESAEDVAIDLLSRKATLVASNVPGPSRQLYMCGSRITQLMFWVPQSGDIGLGISILSYNGQVQFGLVTDHKRVADPGIIASRFSVEFESILLAVLLGPYLRQQT